MIKTDRIRKSLPVPSMSRTLNILLLAALAGALALPAAAAPRVKQKIRPQAAPTASAPAPAASTPAASETAPPAASAAVPSVAAPAVHRPQPLPEIAATAYAVQDLQSGQVLAEKNWETPIEPASLTKLMTAYLVFKALQEGSLKPEQTVTVSARSWGTDGPRMLRLKDSQVSIADLVKGLVVQQSNDAAVALAEAVAGSEEQFVEMMNAEAKRLGMAQTRFENSTGLHGEQHLSSAKDLLILAAALMRDFPPQYYQIYSIKSFTYNGITQPNRNLLLFRDPAVDGIAGGYGGSAGYHLIASSKRNGRRVISVVVGTESMQARAAESSKLLNWALQSYDTPKLYEAETAILQVKVYKGADNAVNVGFIDATYITVPHGQAAQLQPVLETVQPVLAPISKGQVLGTVKFMDAQNRVVAQKDVVALNDVAEAGFFGRLFAVFDVLAYFFEFTFADIGHTAGAVGALGESAYGECPRCFGEKLKFVEIFVRFPFVLRFGDQRHQHSRFGAGFRLNKFFHNRA